MESNRRICAQILPERVGDHTYRDMVFYFEETTEVTGNGGTKTKKSQVQKQSAERKVRY